MKFLQDKGILFRLFVFFGISLFIITPTAIPVMLGWAKIELNATGITIISILSILILAVALALLGFNPNISSKETDQKINQFYNEILPYLRAIPYLGIFLCICYIAYLYVQKKSGMG